MAALLKPAVAVVLEGAIIVIVKRLKEAGVGGKTTYKLLSMVVR